MIFERITAANLDEALKVASEIFPYEVKDGKLSFEDDAYRDSIKENKSDFAYFLVRHYKNDVVGITGYYREEDGTMWLGWFGVLSGHRGWNYGEKILRMTAGMVESHGWVSEFFLYTGQRQEEHHAHRLYERVGFVNTGEGKVEGEPVFYYRASLPLGGK